MVLLFLLAFIPAAYAAALCSYNDGDVSARWAVCVVFFNIFSIKPFLITIGIQLVPGSIELKVNFSWSASQV